MSYKVLYRKYRPKDLTEVYGQHVAVNILKNAIKNNKFGHPNDEVLERIQKLEDIFELELLSDNQFPLLS